MGSKNFRKQNTSKWPEPFKANSPHLFRFSVILFMLLLLPEWGEARESKAVRRELTHYLRQTYVYMEKSDVCGKADKDGWLLAQKNFALYEDNRSRIGHKLAKKPQLELEALEKEAKTLLRDKKDAEAFCRRLSEIKSLLVKALSVAVSPTQIPDLTLGRQVYVQNCAACHGKTGKGDGPLAMGGKAPMTPPPTDFTNPLYVFGASPFRAYNVLLTGIPGSAMGTFDDLLSDNDLWSVAFFLNTLAVTPGGAKPPQGLFTLKELALFSNRELKEGLQAASVKDTNEALRFLRTKAPEDPSIPRSESKAR